MRILILCCILLLSASYAIAQTDYVELDNRIYSFLERMENRGIIDDYNSFAKPLTRGEAASYLLIIKNKETSLNEIDRAALNDLETEFEYELYGSVNNSVRIINNNGYDFKGEKQKYLFFEQTNGFNIFINLFTEIEYIHNYKKNILNNNSFTGNLGGIIRGNINDKFGYYLKGTNGKVFGNRDAALTKPGLAQNFKFSEKPDESFFDETEGYLTADFNLIRFKLGRDRIKLGYGEIPLIDDYSPRFDYLGLYLKYNFFSYSFLHAKMLDIDASGGHPVYSDKFLVYHRIGFNTGKHFDFGIGELVIYGNRGIDLSYLNPFVFYKSIEHSNRDRDNSMLFADINNNSIPNTKLFLTFLIDDISLSKVGTGWWGNQTVVNTGFYINDITGLPLDVAASYQRAEPYTFTHRFSYNSFTNLGYSLSPYSVPNSEIFKGRLTYRINYRFEMSAGFTYILHGANPVSEKGIINVGGDILLGHSDSDPEKASFLDGIREYYRTFFISVFFEPVNQLKINLNISYLNNSSWSKKSHKEVQSFFTLTTAF